MDRITKIETEKVKQKVGVPARVTGSLSDPKTPIPAWAKNSDSNWVEERDYAKEAKIVPAPKPAGTEKPLDNNSTIS